MKSRILSALILSLMAAPAAEAREFYRVKVKTALTHSDFDGTRKMGTARGNLAGGDDGGFARFMLDGEEIPVTALEGWSEGKWIWVKFELDYEGLRRIMHLSNGSLWRSSSHERHVSRLIDRYIDGMKAAGRTKETILAYRTRSKDHTRVRLQFHDDLSPESLHLVIDIADKPRKL